VKVEETEEDLEFTPVNTKPTFLPRIIILSKEDTLNITLDLLIIVKSISGITY